MGLNFDGLVSALIFVGIMIMLIIWGAWGTIDYFFIEDGITTEEPITPEIRLVIKDGVVDTTYYYIGK